MHDERSARSDRECHICEVQIALHAMMTVRKEGGHELYAHTRNAYELLTLQAVKL